MKVTWLNMQQTPSGEVILSKCDNSMKKIHQILATLKNIH